MTTTTISSSLSRKIRIVAINDVYELTNLPRVQTFLSKLEVPPQAVVLAGDFLSPSTLSSVDNGRGMVATLRAMGLTHATLGNHEQVSLFLFESKFVVFFCQVSFYELVVFVNYFSFL